MARFPFMMQSLLVPALLILGLTACGESEKIKEKCVEKGYGSDAQCSCMQEVANGVIKDDPKAEALLEAMVAGDSSQMRQASQPLGELTSANLMLSFAIDVAKSCNFHLK